MQPAAAELLKDLGAVLEELGIPWYVFGAQAVIVHGLLRHTGDVDVTIDPGSHPPHAIVSRLVAAGFQLRITRDVDDFIQKTRVLPLVHLRTRMALDIVLAGPGPEAEFLKRAKRVSAAGVSFPVVSAEDLVVMKILAGRPKDLEDVRGIIRRQGPRLELEATRSRLRELEQLLDQSDLVPRLDEVIRSLRG